MLSLWLILQTVKSAPSGFIYLKCLAIETLDRVSLAKFFWGMVAGIVWQHSGQLLHLLVSKEVIICRTALAVLHVGVVSLVGFL